MDESMSEFREQGVLGSVFNHIYLGARDAASIMYLYRVFMYHFYCNPTDNISHEIIKF
jgi:hypothetical protein